MNNYYSEKQYLFAVDKNDNVVGKVEKWEAHKKGLLHRGFTAILFYDDKIVLQQRKHPIFDGVFDMSFSSHQIFKDEKNQDDLAAVYEGLQREWNIEKKDLVKKPKFLGKIYYKARDPKSKYYEHEIDYIYSVKLNMLPKPNLDFAHGYKLIKKTDLPFDSTAPWVKKIVEKIKF
jgi:isopentenyl-diphosphate Delta-isomerase